MAGKKDRRGLILVNTGNGKGKTTAALGLAFRALGYDMKVLIVQFLKGKWKPGEYRAAERFAPNLKLAPMGQGFLWIDAENQEEQNQLLINRAWEWAREQIFSGDWDMVILDEINYCLMYNPPRIPVEEVVDVLQRKPEMLHLVLTGRGARDEIIALADTVTEMRPVKHAYEKGVAAQKGIEF